MNLIIQIFSIENKINNTKRKLDSNNYDNYIILKVKSDEYGRIKILGLENYYYHDLEIYLNGEKFEVIHGAAGDFNLYNFIIYNN